MKKIITFLAKSLVNSPIYPHWLGDYKMKKAESFILHDIQGDVLEVGSGDGSKKGFLLNKYKGIEKYIATDYSSWDEEFEKVDTYTEKFFGLGQIFFGYKKRVKPDKLCSATDLPFKDESFDYHLSFEVLEHINDPITYFKEAARVVKSGGYIIAAVPFLFCMHGGEPDHELDYFRYANGFFHKMATENNLTMIQIYNNTGYGTTFALLTNQWLIRRVYESNYFMKVPLFIISPVVFVLANLTGLLFDVAPDKRFATRFYVVMQKK